MKSTRLATINRIDTIVTVVTIGLLAALYIFMYFERPVYFIGDLFEYTYHVSNLIKTTYVSELGSFQSGISGNPSYPLYALFPGMFLVVGSIASHAKASPFLTMLVFNGAFVGLFYGMLFVLYKEIAISLMVKPRNYVLAIFVLLSTFYHFNWLYYFNAQLLNYFVAIYLLILFLKYRRGRLSPVAFFRWIVLSALFFPIVHHQSTLVIITIYLTFLFDLIRTKRLFSLFKANLFLIIGVGAALGFHIYRLILPNIGYLTALTKTYGGQVSSISERASEYTVDLISLVILPTLYIQMTLSKQRKRAASVIILLMSLLLIGYFQNPIFGTSFYPHRYIVLLYIIALGLFSSFSMIRFTQPSIRRVKHALLFILCIVTVFRFQRLYISTTESKTIDYQYLRGGLTLWKSNIIPEGSKIFTDPATSFMLLKILDAPQNYPYLRPISNIQDNYFRDIEDMSIFALRKHADIYEQLKKAGYEYVVYDTAISPHWSGANLHGHDPLIWKTLDSSAGFEMIDSYAYDSKSAEARVIVYRIM